MAIVHHGLASLAENSIPGRVDTVTGTADRFIEGREGKTATSAVQCVR